MIRNILLRFGLARDVVYDEDFFAPDWFENWGALAGVMQSIIESRPKWRSILDYGCGPGIMIDRMADAGYRYVGCERSAEARAIYLERYGKHPDRYVGDRGQLDMRGFDVFLSWDVFEHLSDEEARSVLQTTRPIPEVLVNISRARGLPGHINIKSDAAWVALFAEEGCRFDKAGTDELRSVYRKLRPGCPDAWDKNMFLFART